MSAQPWVVCASGILLAVTVRRDLGVQFLIGERRQRGASLWQTSDSILRPVLAISLVWWGGEGRVGLAGLHRGQFVSNMVWSLLRGESRGKQRPGIARHYRADVLAYALPLIPMELIFWVNTLGDRYVIGYLMTAAEVGFYAATYMINEAFNRSTMVLLRTFQPVYFQCFSQNQLRKASGSYGYG